MIANFFQSLSQHGVEYLLISGQATVLYGAATFSEDMPQENAAARGGVRGYTPVTRCAGRLPANIRVISPEELLWRIRMKHDAEQTRKLIAVWPR